MSGNKKKSSSSSLLCCFTITGKNRSSRRRGDEGKDECVRGYKVYPSDEDKGRWVAEPGIDRKAAAYISSRTDQWGKLDNANY